MKKNLRPLLPLALVLAAGCASEDLSYRPAPQILPQHIVRISLRPVINKTQQFGLEDKLTLRVRDEFLRDGRYPIVPESDAQGVVVVTLSRYILVPVQYDTVLTPTAYKLTVLANLDFIDRTKNTILWSEPSLEGVQSYTAPTLRGGMTEEQARELIWDVLARQIVKRTVEGFGSVSGASQRRISGELPPSETPQTPVKSVNPNPY
ncbi:MAG: LPS assembly lipoprotein LptE [Elusimicrobiota bacterium]|jgi:hypothetical protein